MNEQEILRLAIEKAFPDKDVEVDMLKSPCSYCGNTRYIRVEEKYYYSPEEFIFSPEFGKALFGERKSGFPCFEDMYWESNGGVLNFDGEAWQFHQHQMLNEIQEGRSAIKYLEQFLK